MLKAQRTGAGETAPFAPMALEEVVKHIAATKPQVFFAPHVETSAGMVLPDDYIREVGAAVRANDGLFVLDCVASGAVWIDMQALNVDVMVTAPQKGWSSSPSAGVVLMGARALDRMDEIRASSFTVDLGKWHQIMQAYLNGGHAYHATMPTDALLGFNDNMNETLDFSLQNCRAAQERIGSELRAILAEQGYQSVAAEGFQAAPVVVCFAPSAELQNGLGLCRAGVADRGRRAAGHRRRPGLPQLPLRPVRPRQAQEPRAHHQPRARGHGLVAATAASASATRPS